MTRSGSLSIGMSEGGRYSVKPLSLQRWIPHATTLVCPNFTLIQIDYHEENIQPTLGAHDADLGLELLLLLPLRWDAEPSPRATRAAY